MTHAVSHHPCTDPPYRRFWHQISRNLVIVMFRMEHHSSDKHLYNTSWMDAQDRPSVIILCTIEQQESHAEGHLSVAKIGRASCRERREIRGGAGAVDERKAKTCGCD